MQPLSPLGMYAVATCMQASRRMARSGCRMSRGTPSKLKLDEAGFPSPMGKVRRGDTKSLTAEACSTRSAGLADEARRPEIVDKRAEAGGYA